MQKKMKKFEVNFGYNPEPGGLWNDDDPFQQLTNALMNVRRMRNMTQKQMAEATGLTQPDISRLENGRANPSLKTIKNIAEGLGMRLRIELVDIPRNRKTDK